MADQVAVTNETATVTDGAVGAPGPVMVVADTATVTDALVGRADAPSTETFAVPSTRVRKKKVFEGESPEIKDRVWDRYESDYLNRDNVVDIVARVFDLQGDPAVWTHEWAYEWDDVLFDSLQTDASGEPDSVGYNFKAVIPKDWIPEGGRTYRVEYAITVLSDVPGEELREVPVVWQIRVKSRRGT